MEDFIQLLSMFIVGLIIYIGMLMLKRDAFAMEVINIAKNKMKR